MADRGKMASHGTPLKLPSPDEVPTATSSSSTTSSTQPAGGDVYRSEESVTSHPETVDSRVNASEPSFDGTASDNSVYGKFVSDESPWLSSGDEASGDDGHAYTSFFKDPNSNAGVPDQRRQKRHGADGYSYEVHNYRRIKLNKPFQTCPVIDKKTGVAILEQQRDRLKVLKDKLDLEGYTKWGEVAFLQKLMEANNKDIELVSSGRECVRVVDWESYETWRENYWGKKPHDDNFSHQTQEHGSGTKSHYQPDMMHDFPLPQDMHSSAQMTTPSVPNIQLSGAPGLSGSGLHAPSSISAPQIGLPQHHYASSAAIEASGGSVQNNLREIGRVPPENMQPRVRPSLQMQQQQHQLPRQQQLHKGQTSRHDDRFSCISLPRVQHGQYRQHPPTGPSVPEIPSFVLDTSQVQALDQNTQPFTPQTHQYSGVTAGHSYPNVNFPNQRPFHGTSVVQAGQGNVGQQQFYDLQQQGYTPRHGAPPLIHEYVLLQDCQFRLSPDVFSVSHPQYPHPQHAHPQHVPMMGQTPDQYQQNNRQYQFPQVQLPMKPHHHQGHQATRQWQQSSGQEETYYQPQPPGFMEPYRAPYQLSSHFQRGGQQQPPYQGQQFHQRAMLQLPPPQGYLPTGGQHIPGGYAQNFAQGVAATQSAIVQYSPNHPTEEEWRTGE